jgi:hypothetical protein
VTRSEQFGVYLRHLNDAWMAVVRVSRCRPGIRWSSIAGLTTRLYVGEHPAGVAGVVILDPPTTRLLLWSLSGACWRR